MTLKKVCAVFVQILGCEQSQLDCSTEISSLRLDSFEAVELLSSLEEEFGVKLKTAQIKKLKTVGELAEYIDALCADR